MKKFNNIMIYMQLIMMPVLLIALIFCAFKPWFLNITEIICGVTLIIIAYNNHTTYKRKKMTLVYGLFGLFMIGMAIFYILNG